MGLPDSLLPGYSPSGPAPWPWAGPWSPFVFLFLLPTPGGFLASSQKSRQRYWPYLVLLCSGPWALSLDPCQREVFTLKGVPAPCPEAHFFLS